ncbi:dynamin family protein [Nitzschia inconspicua]|uniref:Dynamin family protein n=1 Tax=Nitzschia inconspicua TaxID=303405 RepID=A0A9K3PC80_9STRA|nr:dynamin family protein [Nitzschia inconspicua]
MRIPRRLLGGRTSLLVHVLIVLNLTSDRCCYGRSGFRRPFGVLRIRGGEESHSASPDQYHQQNQYHGYRSDSYARRSIINNNNNNDHNNDTPPVLPGDHRPFSSSTSWQPQHHTEDSYSSHSHDDSNIRNTMSSPQQQQEYQEQNHYSQHDPYQQQPLSQQQGPPPLPSGSYGDGDFEDVSAPPLPGGYNNQMDPRFAGIPPPPMDDSSLFQDGLRDDPNAAVGATFGMDGSSDSSGMDLSSFNKEYILKGLARLYRKKILPLEISSRYGHFHSPPLSPADFVAPPMVLLLGQYSVGKTSFIKYLAGRDFPGIRVGPEPTTDRFTAVLWGNNDKIIPGAALCSQQERPFTGLGPFGNNFLSRLEGVELDVPILRNVTLVDTPGILSGQKQRTRNYDYESVMKWFGERSDLVIVMFDAHKLDISDELKRVMELFIPHLDKIRVVLNKADSISTQQLMRVYGALMWSLGKVMNTPEVCRVYMGSFWDAPLQNTEQAELLQKEEMDLLQDIMDLPQQAVMRRINELVKRARSVKVHAYMVHYLRKQLPYTWGKREKQRRLIDRLESEMNAAARRYGLPKGDFPPLEPFRKALLEIKDLSEIPKLDKKLIKEMDKVFTKDIPDLLDKAREHD